MAINSLFFEKFLENNHFHNVYLAFRLINKDEKI